MKSERLCYVINMCEEIGNFRRELRKRRNGSETGLIKPIVIFDLLSLCYLFLSDTVGMLGGRHELNLRVIQEFLDKLSDADLVFVCDGRIQNGKISEWCKRHDEKDEKATGCMENGEAERGMMFPCNLFVNKVLTFLKQKNFKVIVSTKVDCDQTIAKYAIENKHKVLAVVSTDTDMLIFEGDFHVWSIDMKGLQSRIALKLDRKRLLTSLKLTQSQMKFYATIKGNDFTRHINGRKEVIQPKEVSTFVREKFSSVIEYNESLYKVIANFMLKEDVTPTDDHLKSIEQSLNFYKLNFTLERSENSVNVLKHCLENGHPFQYSVQFLDFEQRSTNKFINLILAAIERSAGILKEQQPYNSELDEITIITKTCVNGKYEEHILAPQTKHNFESVAENAIDIKWKDLLFCLGLHLTNNQIKIIQSQVDMVKVILSVLFLKKVI